MKINFFILKTKLEKTKAYTLSLIVLRAFFCFLQDEIYKTILDFEKYLKLEENDGWMDDNFINPKTVL